MKKVTRWETFNGHSHNDQDDVRDHLDNLRGEIICKMAAALSQIDKYTAAIKYLDSHLDDLAEEIVRINNDKVIDATDQDS
jgi:hypothetical protein